MDKGPDWIYDPVEFVKACNTVAIIWTIQIWQAKMVLAADAFNTWNHIFFDRYK